MCKTISAAKRVRVSQRELHPPKPGCVVDGRSLEKQCLRRSIHAPSKGSEKAWMEVPKHGCASLHPALHFRSTHEINAIDDPAMLMSSISSIIRAARASAPSRERRRPTPGRSSKLCRHGLRQRAQVPQSRPADSRASVFHWGRPPR